MRYSFILATLCLVTATTLAVPSAAQSRAKHAAPPKRAAVQTATVELTDDGYTPAGLHLKAGVPARVTFVRRVAETCGTEVVLPDFGIRRDLPLDEPVVVEFTPAKAGTYTITCGMNMLRGSIVVR